jgi:acyl-CoA synthetase (NDP forming)
MYAFVVQYGINTPKGGVASTPEQAAQVATDLGV